MDLRCPWCNGVSEDVTHTFWSCIQSRKTWKSSNLWTFVRGFIGGSFSDPFCFVLEAGKLEEINLFCSNLLEYMDC